MSFSPPSVIELKAAFSYLDDREFERTGRLPIVAARQWCSAWEMTSVRRFRAGKANIHEVAVPKLYWRMVPKAVRDLFLALTLGRKDRAMSRCPELSALYPQADTSRPSWTLVHRYGRYIARSHPEATETALVYFGDDTLFLMQRARELLRLIEKGKDGSVCCLDLCCGGGGVGLALPPFQGELRGVDLNPVAITLAKAVSTAQGLKNYHYEVAKAENGMDGSYDLIFGNPPTLSPCLTGKEVFFATGTLAYFLELLALVLQALRPTGRAIFTVFSVVSGGRDESYEAIKAEIGDSRGFSYTVRREFPIDEERSLRHCALEIYPESELEVRFFPLASKLTQLPALAWRR